MTVKEMNYTEQKELAELLEAWLGIYTEKVVLKVMNKIDEVLNNETAMKMLKELKERQEKEEKDRRDSFAWMLREIGKTSELTDTHCLHNNCLTHASAYRDVLYDMYIR